MSDLLAYFKIHDVGDLIWLLIGVFAQLMFSLRFIIQWLSSERERRSVVPTAFWWFSVFGGVTLLAYGLHRREPVIILGQAFGIVIYARNLMMIHKAKKSDSVAQA